MSNNEYKTCSLCERAVSFTTEHHLIPRTVHRNKWFKKTFDKQALHHTVPLCQLCHATIHQFFSNKELGRTYNSIEKLRNHPQIVGFLNWLSRGAKK